MSVKLHLPFEKKHIDPPITRLFSIWSQSSPAENRGCRGNKLNPKRRTASGRKGADGEYKSTTKAFYTASVLRNRPFG